MPASALSYLNSRTDKLLQRLDGLLAEPASKCVSGVALHPVPTLVSSRSSANSNAAGSQEMSFPSTGAKVTTNCNAEITADHVAERAAFALQQWGREKSAPIKRVQQIAKVDRKTAAKWFSGESPPRVEHFLTLARHVPELKAEIRRLLDMEQDCSPDLARELSEVVRKYVRP